MRFLAVFDDVTGECEVHPICQSDLYVFITLGAL